MQVAVRSTGGRRIQAAASKIAPATSSAIQTIDRPIAVPTRADLLAWQDHLEANGVVRSDMANKPLTQSPIADEPYGSVLVFRDPDNIQLEMFAPPGS